MTTNIRFLFFVVGVGAVLGLPVVDKGVFVITGVKTCGQGAGYCILGGDCTVDKEFIPDERNGNCDGLRKAFTPRAFFVCCQFVNQTHPATTTPATTSTTTQEIISNSNELKSDSDESVESPETVESLESDEVMTTTEPVSMTTKSETTQEDTSDVETTPLMSSNEVQVVTEISSTFIKTYSCDLEGDSGRDNRLAAQDPPLTSCWTGAITRTPPSHSPLPYNDPGSFICTGAIISDTLLLTTATCVSRLFGSQDLSQYKIALGSRHLLHPAHGPTPDAEYRDIKELVIHEDYQVNGLLRVNDIALVKMSDRDTTTLRDKPYCIVCLPERANEDHAGEECIVSGYSHPTAASSAGQTVESSDGILHSATQQIEFPQNCEPILTNYSNTLSYRGDDSNYGLLCASGKYAAEACFSPRDAGSPLACPTHSNQNGYRLLGLFSSGFHCGTTQMPVLYSDVSHYLDWIGKFMSLEILK